MTFLNKTASFPDYKTYFFTWLLLGEENLFWKSRALWSVPWRIQFEINAKIYPWGQSLLILQQILRKSSYFLVPKYRFFHLFLLQFGIPCSKKDLVQRRQLKPPVPSAETFWKARNCKEQQDRAPTALAAQTHLAPETGTLPRHHQLFQGQSPQAQT